MSNKYMNRYIQLKKLRNECVRIVWRTFDGIKRK